MNIYPIHNEKDYQLALRRIEELMEVSAHTKEADELEILSTLVNIYEENIYPINAPDPIEAIRFRMEQMGINPKKLGELTQTRSNRIYEILNRSRPLTLSMIRKLNKILKISSEILIKEYGLRISSHS